MAEIEQTQAVVWQAQTGQWLAMSAPGSAVRIAVRDDSRHHAVESFRAALSRWARYFDDVEGIKEP